MKQRKPKTIDTAVRATLELESYLVKPKQGIVAAVQAGPTQATLLEMMEELMTQMNKFWWLLGTTQDITQIKTDPVL